MQLVSILPLIFRRSFFLSPSFRSFVRALSVLVLTVASYNFVHGYHASSSSSSFERPDLLSPSCDALTWLLTSFLVWFPVPIDSQKIYFSGPLVRCNERTADGTRASRDSDWHDVWAQLGGTSLSVWDMKAIEEAQKSGTQAPPSYINVTDAVGFSFVS